MSILASISSLGADANEAIGEPTVLRNGRYEIRAFVDRRETVEWYSGVRRGDADGASIRIGREPLLPSRDSLEWPSLAWEAHVRTRAQHLGLPRIVDRFDEGQHSYLILEDPAGLSLWDAWDSPNTSRSEQFGWLLKLADLIRSLHRSAAMVECLRPEFIRVSPLGEVMLTPDASPIPLPPTPGLPLRLHLVSAPELIRNAPVDARADLYHFGTLLYALELGRELTDLDFDGPGLLKPVLSYDPDLHPCLGRLLARTLAFERGNRFPSDNGRDDLSGFGELIRILERAQTLLTRPRLDVAAWTTTGMVRGNNEDAVAIVHGSELREAADNEWAFIALADGLGGNAAGEVAAALTIQSLRRAMTYPASRCDAADNEISDAPPVPDITIAIETALRDANRAVYLAGRSENQHGMGCTAEAVCVKGGEIIVGHVGDSRTYLFHGGALVQLTRDQTFLADLFDRRAITAEEMRSHPRRGELTQAIGGRSDVNPQIVRTPFAPGDWLVVCSDGLTARVSDEQIVEILESASSAESAARRLINRANAAGAADNVTVAVVRGC